jgi:uncharacterized protein YbcC (UPF0753/DUF2309 family)
MEYFVDKKEIRLDKKLSNLDKLVLKFIGILENYADYVIISGYVSILLGRSRATEDVDLFIKPISFDRFSQLYESLTKRGFCCINTEKPFEMFSYLRDGLAIRFAREGESIPNFEVKFTKKKSDEDAFEDFIQVKLLDGKIIKISSLERQIAFKRYFLGSKKDFEDALHVEEVFKEKLDYEKINKFKELIERNKIIEGNKDKNRDKMENL